LRTSKNSFPSPATIGLAIHGKLAGPVMSRTYAPVVRWYTLLS
jgi:hypothetical protein